MRPHHHSRIASISSSIAWPLQFGRRRSPSIAEEEYLYKRLMPKYGHFVVTVTSFDDSVHFRFLDHFFQRNKECIPSPDPNGTLILQEQRPKLYRFYGAARRMQINNKTLSVTTFPCSSWTPFRRRLALLRHCAFTVIVVSILDLDLLENLETSWIIRNRHHFKDTKLILIGLDAECRYCSAQNVAAFTGNESLKNIPDVIWSLIFEFCNESKYEMVHRIPTVVHEPNKERLSMECNQSELINDHDSLRVNDQFIKTLNENQTENVEENRCSKSWTQTVREWIFPKIKRKEEDGADREWVNEDDDSLLDSERVLDLKNSIKVVARDRIQEMVRKYDLQYFECFNSTDHINHTMHCVLADIKETEKHAMSCECKTACCVL